MGSWCYVDVGPGVVFRCCYAAGVLEWDARVGPKLKEVLKFGKRLETR